MPTSSKFSKAVQAFFSEYGYQKRVTGASAVPSRMFETSDKVDVPIGSKAYDRTLRSDNAQKLNAKCWAAYKKNPIIWGSVELVIRATVGKEAKLVHNLLESEKPEEVAQAQKVQPILDAWWNAPENNWPLLAEQVQRDLILFGEVIPLFLVNRMTGDVEVGFINANSIKELVRDKLNARRILGVKVQLEGGIDRVLKIVHKHAGGGMPEEKPEPWREVYTNVAADKLVGRHVGEVFYWSLNQSLSSQRGHGDFAQVLDPANDALKIVRGITDRIQLNNRVWSELIFPDTYTPEQINDMLDPTSTNYINPPRFDDDPNKEEEDDFRVFGHSTNIEFKLVNPGIAATENVEVFKMALATFSAGTNIPLHWMGWADELTYASAQDISTITIKYFTDRQNQFRRVIKAATNFQIDQKRIFTSALDGIPDEVIYDYDVVLPPIDTRSLEQIVGIMKQRVDAILAAKLGGVIDPEQIQDLIQQALRDGGFKVAG